MDDNGLFERLTANRHSRAFFHMNREWAKREEARISFSESLGEMLTSGNDTILGVIEEVDTLSPDPEECARKIEAQAQAYLESYDSNLEGIMLLGRKRPEQSVPSLITERASGLRTFGEFLVNSLGIAHSYLRFLKKHSNPPIEAEMGMLFRRAYVVLRSLESVH